MVNPPAAAANGAAAASPRGAIRIEYLHRSPVRVQGPATGRIYDFSGARPVVSVDAGDAPTLLATGYFRAL